jgi:signal transduction histidine kinase
VYLGCNKNFAALDGKADPRELIGRTDFDMARAEGASIVVVFRDSGAGIDAENLPRLFQQGFSTRKDGHGLGLHTSWLTIQALGGTLVAESVGRGAGAMFTVTLPVEGSDGVVAA